MKSWQAESEVPKIFRCL